MTLQQEINELIRRAKALTKLIGHSHEFGLLDPAEQERLKVQNDSLWSYIESVQARLNAYKDGESCGHPGCLNHFTRPCENCGRIAGVAYSISNSVSFTYLGWDGNMKFKCSGCSAQFYHVGQGRLVCPNCGGA